MQGTIRVFTLLQKCTLAKIRDVPDSLYEYVYMFERTSRESLRYFRDSVISLYSKEIFPYQLKMAFSLYMLHMSNDMVFRGCWEA
ncbi:hypothetical protein HanIR_Chr11g0520841 [Helianthus annuus]|nr:hypothetical protein HanIR_Chr11g0520841 [Helianthus annuus]